MKQFITILAILGLIAGLNAKSYSIAYYGFDINVDTSGCSATVTETMTYSFTGGSFQGAERSIALNGHSGYPSNINFISLTSPTTTATVTANFIQDGYWILQWTYPPSSGQQTFVITYKADVLFTKNKGAQNYFDYVLIGAEWQNFAGFYGGFNNINVTMTLPDSAKGLTVSPTYTSKDQVNGNTVLNWRQAYWSAGSVYDVTATFDSLNSNCRSADGPGILGWVVAIIVIACFFVVLSVVVTILRCFCGVCMWRGGSYTVVADSGYHHHHGHHHHHSSGGSSSTPARTGGGGAW